MADRVLPESTKRITQSYKSGTHPAVDLSWRNDESQNIVYAHSSGTVKKAVDGKNQNLGSSGEESYGNYVFIQHKCDYSTRYAHLKKGTVKVKTGDKVVKGQELGVIGESGNAKGRHLHFEVHNGNLGRVNPTSYLNSSLPGNELEDDFVGPIPSRYQVHSSSYGWDYNVSVPNVNLSNYAGKFGYAIDAIYLDTFKIRVHDQVKNKWLPWVENRSDYAGNFGNPIDGIQVEGVKYRVHIKGGTWLDWVSKVDNTAQGYAGIYGKSIDAIQIVYK